MAFGIDWGAVAMRETRRAILWFPVLMGVGVWIYFSWPAEPPDWSAWLWAVPLVLLLRRKLRARIAFRAGLFALLALSVGHGLAHWQAHSAAHPALMWRVAATVEGRVIARDRSASDAPRVVLDRVTVFGFEAALTPARVRIALIETPFAEAPRPGEVIRVHATLLPPGDPVEPGAFDFGRRAYFERIGGVGYARAPPLRVPPGEAIDPGAGGWLDRGRIWLADLRLELADAIRAGLPGDAGAFAAAIMVGDRAGISEADAEALRISSLAHLLAISGLHMGLLTGLVFAAARLLLAASAVLSLRCSTKKLAAIAALAAGAGYLMLSGATVATQRAFVMVAVAFIAILLDRPAISLRGLAVAAVVVLAIRPISVFDVGFQMSFAATVALVASYEELRRRARARRDAGEEPRAMRLPAARLPVLRLPPIGALLPAGAAGRIARAFSLAPPALPLISHALGSAASGEAGRAPAAGLGSDSAPAAAARARPAGRPLPGGLRGLMSGQPRAILGVVGLWAGGVLLTSLIAGTATTPFSSYHFNRLAPYGLIANLGAVPVMGLLIAPAGIAAALAAPFGLADAPLRVMGWGIDWVLAVAHGVTALPGSDRVVPAAAPEHLALVALGGLWIALWQGRLRLFGLPPLVLGMVLWSVDPPPRPPVLVSPGGQLLGALGPEGRALDRAKGQGFAAETWLRRDGDGATQAVAAARPGLELDGRIVTVDLGNGARVVAVGTSTLDRAALARLCTSGTVLIARLARDLPTGRACILYGPRRLDRAGALAIWPDGPGAVRVEESADRTPRIWNRRFRMAGVE